MIALAIAGRPSLLVADEPTTALDVTVERAILGLLGHLRRDTGMSVVMVSHDLAVVEETADCVAVMYAGITVEFGATAAVFASPAHPYTRALLAARPGARKPGERLMDIPGYPPNPHAWPFGCRFAPRCRHAAQECLDAVPTAHRLDAKHVVNCIRVEELANGDELIHVAGAAVTFRGASSPAIADIDLGIDAGTSLGIVGESGSRKTTLARIITGALQPTIGAVLVDGRMWRQVHRTDRQRASIQMVFQDAVGARTRIDRAGNRRRGAARLAQTRPLGSSIAR